MTTPLDTSRWRIGVAHPLDVEIGADARIGGDGDIALVGGQSKLPKGTVVPPGAATQERRRPPNASDRSMPLVESEVEGRASLADHQTRCRAHDGPSMCAE